MEGLSNRGQIEEAYTVGCTLEGASREVLSAWLKEVEDRLRFEQVMEQMKMHIERNL